MNLDAPNQPPTPAQKERAAAATPQPDSAHMTAIVDRWFHDHIYNSPVARHTDALNHLRGALDDLKHRLTEI